MTPAPCLSHAGRPKAGYRRGPRLDRAERLTRQESGMPARRYWCPAHGLWHVTTQEER